MAAKDQSKEKDAAPKKVGKKATAGAMSAVASQTVSIILKATGQKPLQPSYTQMPHAPSGSSVVDNLIGGSMATDGKGPVCPGYPRRRITEIYGIESSGKTTLALAAISHVQRAGGIAMFLDFEHALHHGYAKTIGVAFEPTKLLYYQPDTLEEGLKMIYVGIRTGIDLIVLDSVAAMVPKAELEKKLDDAARVGALAKALSEVLPKMVLWLSKPCQDRPGHSGTAVIFLNQTRALIQTGGGGKGKGDTENTAGGKALKFYAYVRLRLQRIRSDYIKRKDQFTGKERSTPVGNLVDVKVVKNKCDAKQGHAGEIFIRYGFGLDDYLSVIEAGITRKIIPKGSGAWLDFDGERFQGKEKLRKYLIDHNDKYLDLCKKVTKSMLDAAPQPIAEVEEDSILSELGKEIGDDEVIDGETSLEMPETTEAAEEDVGELAPEGDGDETGGGDESGGGDETGDDES